MAMSGVVMRAYLGPSGTSEFVSPGVTMELLLALAETNRPVYVP